jgi:hypothetical protein
LLPSAPGVQCSHRLRATTCAVNRPVVNALRDLKAKRAGLPLWQLLSRLSPEEIVDLVDFRYLTDALRPAEALGILQRAETGPRAREERLRELGYPTYTTTPGWLGYDDQKLYRLCREAVSEGFRQVKLKVGADLDADIRRMALARGGPWAPTCGSRSTPTSDGTWTTRSPGSKPSPSSTPGEWRSRPSSGLIDDIAGWATISVKMSCSWSGRANGGPGSSWRWDATARGAGTGPGGVKT